MELMLAGRGRRLAATLIDLVAVPALAILLMLVTGVLEHAEDWSSAARPFVRALGLGLASYVILNLWPLWQCGQTVGKAIMGIAIVSTKTGEKLALWRLVIRGVFFAMLYLILMVIVAPLLAAIPVVDTVLIFGKRRRCLHDLICGSSVVRANTQLSSRPQ